jgi:DNA helicase HerA-like ATPase
MNAQDAELARLRAEAEAARAALELKEAEARLAAAEAAAQAAGSTGVAGHPAAPDPATAPEAPEAPEAPAAPQAAPASGTDGPLSADEVAGISQAYSFEGPTLDMGALLNGDPVTEAQIRIPLSMLNRHGLVAGATGTGKTRTLQGMAEQIAAAGVPVFAADMKGDLSGMAVPGESSEKLLSRTKAIGQEWEATPSAVEFYSLGDAEDAARSGVPVRATVSGFGPLLLSKVLGLNDTQESSLGLVFHYADAHGLALVDLEDLRTLLLYLTGEGKEELKTIGGLSSATAGVLLRELVAFAESGADVFFGEPEFDVMDFVKTAPDGRGVLSLLELPGVAGRPELFSTFLMYLLAELYEKLPEVGDQDRPKLVFFLDEAHLLFTGASKDFIQAITQTVRLIRSKGVGVFFVTQSPKDVHKDVLAQLGSRVQHALRAFTPDDAKALKATVGTYPKSGYDLERVLQELGTGEAIVTVMNEKGSPTPVAWTRVRAPQGLMNAAPAEVVAQAVAASGQLARYGTRIDPESAHELLTQKMEKAAEAQKAAESAKEQASAPKPAKAKSAPARKTRSPMDRVVEKAATQVVNQLIRGIFGNGKRRR